MKLMPINPQEPMPMKNILACTDGSLYAPSVYQHAAWAAQKLEASIHVLHMLNPHHEKPVTTDFSGSIGFGAKSSLLEELVQLEATRAKIAQKRGQAIITHAQQSIQAAGIESVFADQKHGKLSEEITEYERDADLVLLGKRGNNADFETGHLGSNLERVIRSCQHPVLVAARAFTPIKSFALAYDGSESAQKAVDYAAASPLLQGTQCHLLYVGPAEAEIESSLATAAAKLIAAGLEVKLQQRSGEPQEVILEFVTQQKIDLLVMGAYGHSQIRQFIVGSTTSALIRQVQISVLLFR